MKRISLLLPFLLCFLAGCKNDDPVVVDACRHKLYASEVQSKIPAGLSTEDSASIANRIIEDWIYETLILEEANKVLSIKEKDFSKEMEEYRKMLLKQRYFEKITSDASQFQVSDEEVRAAINGGKGKLVNDKEIVKLNYVKLAKGNPLIPVLREILFDEERRLSEKETIQSLCADSVEYFIDDDQWLFWDDVQLGIEIPFEAKPGTYELPHTYEKCIDEDYYLVVLLDYKAEQTGEESKEYCESIRTMLIQQKKNEFINKKISELYQKAEKRGKINR